MELKSALSYDDVLLVPQFSSILPAEVDTTTQLVKNIKLKIPLVSAAMDTVTEYEMATVMAKSGGIGIIHRNMTIEEQAYNVEKVKRAEMLIIYDMVTLSPEDTVEKAEEIAEKRKISGFPVVLKRKLVGIVTHRDLRFASQKEKIKKVMTRKVITGSPHMSMEEAKKIMCRHKIEKLPLVDGRNNLKGLMTLRDIESTINFPDTTKDKKGSLRVGAAVGVNDEKRVEALVGKNVDVVVVDTAHGHTKNVIAAVKKIKDNFSVPVIAGNVVTPEAVDDLYAAGADAVKIGVGPGSICTTRIVAGIGVPQFTAVKECAERAKEYNMSAIADGGIRYSGDIAKAIAAGANSVMIGSLLAGTDEAPGRVIFMNGRKYKEYRGMGSVGAMLKGSKERYLQKEIKKKEKLVPEGVEAVVPYSGRAREVLYQLAGGLKSSMGYVGAKSIDEMQEKAKFIVVTNSGMKESHPHDVFITDNAPNYPLK